MNYQSGYLSPGPGKIPKKRRWKNEEENKG